MSEDLEEDFDDEEGSGETELAPPSSSGLVKKVLVIVVPLLVVLGGGAIYFTGAAAPVMRMVGLGGGGHDAEAKEHGEPSKEQAHGKDGHAQPATIYFDLPDMLVNLNTAGRRQTFLKIRLSLELSDPADVQRVEHAIPRIVDNFQVYLRERKVEDLQGAKGMEDLRVQLLDRARVAAAPAKIGAVLFKDMLVQ